MSSSTRVVVTDLDGTLWEGDEVVPAATVAAIHELRRRGIELLVATGRRLRAATRGLAPAGLAPPAVLLSGAIGADLATGDEWHRLAFDAATGAAVLQAFRNANLEPVAYLGTASVDAIAGPNCSTTDAHIASFGPWLQRGAPDEVVASGRAVGFGIIGVDEDTLRGVAAVLDGLASNWLGPDITYGGATLMVGPAGVEKVDGIRTWTQRRGIDPSQVMAIGDGSNDLAMLEWAGTAVAMPSHDPRVTAAADHHLDGPSHWASVLDLV